MNVTRSMVMDLAQPGIPPRAWGVQGDSGTRSLRLELRSGGALWTVPEGAELVIRYRRRDGTGGSYDTLPDGTRAWSAQGSLLTVALAPQVCAVAGVVELDLTLMKEGKQISTFPVELRISRPLTEMGEEGSYVNLSAWLEAHGAGAGERGEDGVGIDTVIQTTTSLTDGGTNVITVTKTDGTTAVFQVKNGSKGSKGDAPLRGVDYWTAEDIAQIKAYVEEAILGGAW